MNERWDIITDPKDINKIMKYPMNNYAHIFSNLDKMYQFFKDHKLPQLTQDEIDKAINPIFIK